MPDETVLRFVLQEDPSSRQERERALGPGHPGMGQPVIPLSPSEYERRQFGGLIPSPPLPGSTGGAPITGTIPPVERLAQAAERLAALADQRAKPPIRAAPATPRGSPFAEEEPEGPGSDGASALSPFAGAVGPFAGAIATRITGSATVGGFAGMGAQRAMEGLTGLGPVGVAAAGALAGVAIGATAAKEAFSALVRATEAAAESVRGVSPDVAMAFAEREVTDIRTRMRRAQEFGPQLGGFVRAQTRLEEAIEDLKTDLLGELTPLLTDVVDGLKILVDAFGPSIGELVKMGVAKIEDLQNKAMALTAIVELINQGEFPTAKRIRQIVEEARRIMEEDDGKYDVREMLKVLDPGRQRAALEARLGVEPLNMPPGAGIF